MNRTPISRPMGKPKRKQNPHNERNYVELFLNALKDYSNKHLLIVQDLDSSKRVFKSGFDFGIYANGRVVLIEAKKTEKPAKDILKKLSGFQKLTAYQACFSDTRYYILEFATSEKVGKPDLDKCDVLVHRTHLNSKKELKISLIPCSTYESFFDFILALLWE